MTNESYTEKPKLSLTVDVRLSLDPSLIPTSEVAREYVRTVVGDALLHQDGTDKWLTGFVILATSWGIEP
jgi:hypothetical protein